MSFVPGFKYDVYVSYDQPLVGAKSGWVSNFTRNLFTLSARRLGLGAEFTPFTGRMSGQEEIGHLLDIVRGSAILVVILSPGYGASEYCQDELRSFLDSNPRREPKDLFIVEMLKPDRENRSAGLLSSKGHRFWREDENAHVATLGYFDQTDIDYAKRLDELAQDIVQRLRELHDAPASPSQRQQIPQLELLDHPIAVAAPPLPEAPPSDGSRHIFVSYCNADEPAAVAIVSDLERAGFRCWIANRDVYENYQEEIVEAIESADAMVLVFSENTNKSEEMEKELAIASECKIRRIPIRVESTIATGAFKYELSTNQYLDYFANKETYLQRLIVRLTWIRARRGD
jgi:hypothetical protein